MAGDSQIEVGDQVWLRTGGVPGGMIVKDVGDDLGTPSAWVQWYDGKKKREEVFALVALTKDAPRPKKVGIRTGRFIPPGAGPR